MLSSPQSAAFTLLACMMLPAALAEEGRPKSARSDPVEDEGALSVDFSGGSVAEYVAALKEKKEDINVVVGPDAAAVLMPAVSLKNASVEDSLELIQQIGAGRNINLNVNRVGSRTRQVSSPLKKGLSR